MSIKLPDIETQYQNNPDLKKSDVEVIQTWLKEKPHYPEILEFQIILFLHSCYYDTDKAKVAIRNYFKLRTGAPEIFCHVNEDVIRKVLTTIFITVMPGTTSEGYSVMWMKLRDPRPQSYDCLNTARVSIMLQDLFLHRSDCRKGVVFVQDMQGLSFGHITRLNMSALRKLTAFTQEAAPLRIKGIHYINMGYWTEKILTLFRPFLKKELVDMMHFHTSATLESLKEHIPIPSIPNEYGGEGGAIESLTETNIATLLENMEFFKWHDNQVIAGKA